MELAFLDWLIILSYAAFAVWVGLRYAKRAGEDVEQFFLSGRSLPWWIAGTSMVATTFASDTPLVITGWVRDAGIWKNWLWWCYAGGGVLTIFVFARYWRRGELMTTAELAELRYGGSSAKVLRGFLGFYHAAISNTIILCWVMLAAAKIMDVGVDVDKSVALAIACVLALSYSLLAGFWGVVVTDLVQFLMAMTGAIALAVISWNAIDGTEGMLAAAAEGGIFTSDTLSFFPTPGPGGFMDASFWTVQVAAIAVYLGVAWWFYELVDGGGLAVQRISATKDERAGVLASLWYNFAHYALRPWPWILVALASMVVLPHIELNAPAAGTVLSADAQAIVIDTGAGEPVRLALEDPELYEPDWHPQILKVEAGDTVEQGDLLARSDSERAYVVMATRYLPMGLLGLMIASLLAAFMSTIDTHVNLASSYFVNDIYRRFIKKDGSDRHYVAMARISSAVVLIIGAAFAWQSDSISSLFTLFLSFIAGVGPVYIMRWLWWRVRASTEITAMLASSITTIVLSSHWLVEEGAWTPGPLAPDGFLAHEGRLLFIVAISASAALLSMALTRTPDPQSLVPFFKRVRPMGWWGPVAELCPDVKRERDLKPVLAGVFGSLAMIYGAMIGIGLFFLRAEQGSELALAAVVCAVGTLATFWALKKLVPRNG